MRDLYIERIMGGIRQWLTRLALGRYWRRRASTYGARSVLNIAHTASEYDEVTRRQKEYLFPILKSQLTGTERLVLDFGCGPGRFTEDLAEIVGGRAVGVDITPELLALAPQGPRTTFRRIKGTNLPLASNSFDVIWICLVLGGIPDADLGRALAEIRRVLKPRGLLFCAENTHDGASSGHWFFRSPQQYLQRCAFSVPAIVGEYVDIGQRITVFAGRKGSQS